MAADDPKNQNQTNPPNNDINDTTVDSADKFLRQQHRANQKIIEQYAQNDKGSQARTAYADDFRSYLNAVKKKRVESWLQLEGTPAQEISSVVDALTKATHTDDLDYKRAYAAYEYDHPGAVQEMLSKDPMFPERNRSDVQDAVRFAYPLTDRLHEADYWKVNPRSTEPWRVQLRQNIQNGWKNLTDLGQLRQTIIDSPISPDLKQEQLQRLDKTTSGLRNTLLASVERDIRYDSYGKLGDEEIYELDRYQNALQHYQDTAQTFTTSLDSPKNEVADSNSAAEIDKTKSSSVAVLDRPDEAQAANDVVNPVEAHQTSAADGQSTVDQTPIQPTDETANQRYERQVSGNLLASIPSLDQQLATLGTEDNPPQPEGMIEARPGLEPTLPAIPTSIPAQQPDDNNAQPPDGRSPDQKRAISTLSISENLDILQDFSRFVAAKKAQGQTPEGLRALLTEFKAGPGAKYTNIEGLSETYIFNELHDLTAVASEQEIFAHVDLIEGQLVTSAAIGHQLKLGPARPNTYTKNIALVDDYKKRAAAPRPDRRGTGALSYDLDVFKNYLTNRAARIYAEHKAAEAVRLAQEAKDQYAIQVIQTINELKANTAQQVEQKKPTQPIQFPGREPAPPVSVITQDEADAAVFVADKLYDSKVPLDAQSIAAYLQQNGQQFTQAYQEKLQQDYKGADPSYLDVKSAQLNTIIQTSEIFAANNETDSAVVKAIRTEAYAKALKTYERVTYFPLVGQSAEVATSAEGAVNPAVTLQGRFDRTLEELERGGIIHPPGTVARLSPQDREIGAFMARQALVQASAHLGEDPNLLMAQALQRGLGNKIQLSTQALANQKIAELLGDETLRKNLEAAALRYRLFRASQGDEEAQQQLVEDLDQLPPEYMAFKDRINAAQQLNEQLGSLPTEDPMLDAIADVADVVEQSPDIIIDATDAEQVAVTTTMHSNETPGTEGPFTQTVVASSAADGISSPPPDDVATAQDFDQEFKKDPRILYLLYAAQFSLMINLAVARGDIVQAELYKKMINDSRHLFLHHQKQEVFKRFLKHYYGSSFGKWILKSKALKIAAMNYASMPMAFARAYALTGAKYAAMAPFAPAALGWRYVAGPKMPKIINPNRVTAKEAKKIDKYAQKWQKYRQSRRYRYFHQPVIQRYKNYSAWGRYYTDRTKYIAGAPGRKIKSAYKKSITWLKKTKAGRAVLKVIGKAIKPLRYLKFLAKKLLARIMAFLMAIDIIRRMMKLLKRLATVVGIYLYMLWLWVAGHIGAIIGMVVGGAIGGITGLIAGGIIGFKVGFAIGGIIGGPIGAVIGGIIGSAIGGAIGFLAGTAVGATIGAILGYAFQYLILPNLFGAGFGASLGLLLTGGNPLGAMAGAYLGAQTEQLLKKYVFPKIGTNIEIFFSKLLHGVQSFFSHVGGFLNNFFGSVSGSFSASSASAAGLTTTSVSYGATFSILGISGVLTIIGIIVAVIFIPLPTSAVTQIKITAPPHVNNGDAIPYKIAADVPTCTGQVTITNPLPKSGSLKNLDPPSVSNGNGIQSISALIDTSGIKWTIEVNSPNGCGGTNNGGGNGLTHNPGSVPGDFTEDNFAALLKGQARNNPFASEDEYIQHVVHNSKEHRPAAFEAQYRRIYQESIAKNVNPLIITVISGTETGFSLDDPYVFSCKTQAGGGPPGFDNQLTCAVNTLNNFFIKYDELVKDIRNGGKAPIPKQVKVNGVWQYTGDYCYFDDPLLYALDWYGPVCHANDGNQNFHPMFYEFYTEFLKG